MENRIARTKEPSPAIIGKLKVGEKVRNANGKEYPTSRDYFIPDSKYKAMFTQKFGEQPRLIPIIFVSDDDCVERYEYRDEKGDLVASGDGTCFKVFDGKSYQDFCKDDHPDIMERIATKNKSQKGWEVTLTLRFIIPTMPALGYWQLTTKGNESSIPQMIAAFDLIVKHKGTATNTLFDLSVAFAKSQKPGDKSRYPVISLVPNADPQRIEEVKSEFINNQKLLSQ